MATFRPKENARPEFLLMVMESWTYNRMTVDEKSTCLDKIITATIKGRFLQRWTQLQAVFSEYLDSIGYTGAGWRDAQNVHTEPEPAETAQDTTCTDTEPQEGTEDAQKTADKTTDMETFRKAYSAAYTALYDHCGEPETDEKERYYCALFDQEAEAIADTVRRFCAYRGDLVSSDREAAAFMIALETVGAPTDGETATDGETTTTTETDAQRATESAETTAEATTESTTEEITEKTEESTNYIARAWHNGKIIAEETIQAPNYERARAVARFLLSAGLYITVERATETEGTRHAGETTPTTASCNNTPTQRDTSGETAPRGRDSAAVLRSPMIRGRVAVCVGVLSRYGSIVSLSGVPLVVSAGMERHTPRHACRIAPQRTEPAQPYTTTTPRNKPPPRGCYSFARFQHDFMV